MVRFALTVLMLVAGFRPVHAGVHVLDDSEANGRRTIVVVVSDGDDCVDLTLLKSTNAIRAVTACALEITAKIGEDIVLSAPDGVHRIPSPLPVVIAPPRLIPDPEQPLQVAASVVPSLRVGVSTMSAVIVAYERGKPTSNVELQINSERATLRRLHWRDGHAELELVVTSYAPTIDLRISSETTSLQFEIPIDAGAPIVVTKPPIDHVEAGVPFALSTRVETVHGAPIERDRVRLLPPAACTQVAGGYRCSPGHQRFIVQLHTAEGVIPIDRLEIAAANPPTTTATVTWELAARGLRDGWGNFGGGIGARLSFRRHAAWWFEGIAGWNARTGRLAGIDPVSAGLALFRNELALGACIAGRVQHFEARWSAGPALTIDRGAVSSMDVPTYRATTVGLVAWSSIAIGIQLPVPPTVADRARFDIGLQLSRDLASTEWQRPASQLFTELSVGW